jgi:eukaryotic-like serine/threonine-protein kinase
MELKRLGKYEIVAKIGQGAMGEVYRAHDPVLGRDVAIKTMAPGVVADDDLRKRFRREAQSAARMNHPNIITVHDFGEEAGHVYMAMELLEGFDLKELIARQTPMPLEAKLSLMEQICDGLAFAHAHDVVHRDLKPANIHILPSGQVRIMDFGLARVSTSDMTRAGAIMGTPNYMSPEQVRGEKATTRSDVFSLGAVFYELLGGRKPFDAESLPAILYQVMQLEPEPLERVRPDLPPSLCRVVARALAKSASDRYADGGEMRAALRDLRLPVTDVQAIEGSSAPSRAPASVPGVRSDAGARTSRPTITRIPAAGSPSRDATVAAPAPDETVAVRQATLSGGAPTQVPATVLERPPVPGRKAAGPRVAAALVVTALAAGGIYVATIRRPRSEPVVPTAAPPATAPASPRPPLSLDSARQSLRQKAYRDAASRAQEVLREEPGNVDARQVLEEAGKGLADIEAAAGPVREALGAGDTESAMKALARLQALDPAGAETTVLATRVSDVVNGRVQEVRASMERARREAEGGPGRTTPDFASASATARQGEAALRQGDLGLAARRFALARDGFEKAREAPTAPAAAAAKTETAPPQMPPTSLGPAPAPPAATLPSPPTVPPAPVETEAAARQAIRGVLDEYRQAFENRNVDALKAVQPGVDYEAMKKTFAEVTSYGVKIQIQNVTVEGTRATATGIVTYRPVPKPAGRIQPVLTVFHLRKSADLWLIERLERK